MKRLFYLLLIPVLLLSCKNEYQEDELFPTTDTAINSSSPLEFALMSKINGI